jgi:hypothetical protein
MTVDRLSIVWLTKQEIQAYDDDKKGAKITWSFSGVMFLRPVVA